MVDWSLTETTMYCEALGMYVAIVVFEDGQVQCSGHKKYFGKPVRPSYEKGRSRGKGKENLRCEGLECERVTAYRNKILSEEAGYVLAQYDVKSSIVK